MARTGTIPTFQAPAPGINPDRSYAPLDALAAPGQAATQLGSAISRIGEDVTQLAARRAEQYGLDHWAEATTAHQDNLQNEIEQARQTGNYQGLTQRVKEAMDADLQQRIDNAPDSLVAARLQRRFAVLRQQVSARATAFEHGMEIQDAGAKLANGLDGLAKTVYRDPSLADEFFAQGRVMIGDAARAGNLDPRTRQKLDQQFANQLWGAAIDRGLETDPTNTAKALQGGAYDQFLDLPTLERLRGKIDHALAAGALPQVMNGITAGAVPSGGPGTGDGHVAPQSERIAFARQYAESQGLNPAAVVATMAGEGLSKYVGDGGTSFGDLQLHVGGGMGDQALAAGINIRDPNTWREQLKFGIDQMAANRDKGAAWYAGQWHGAPAWAAQSFHRAGAPASGVGQPVAVGDSLSSHLITFAGAGGRTDRNSVRNFRPGDTAVSGATPSEILNNVIPALPDDAIRGKPVILSTGASNDPAQLDAIPQQIAALKQRGAASVTVLGVGPAAGAGVNDQLAQIATQNGAAFAGPLQSVKADGIHAADNAALLAQAKAATPASGDGAAAPAPAAGGSDAPALAEIMHRIEQRSDLTPGAKALLQTQARVQYNALEADQARGQRLQAQGQAAAVKQAEDAVIADVFSEKPKITAQQIAQDPAFSGDPSARLRMIQLINSQGKGGQTPTDASHQAAIGLIQRIRKPEGDPDKLTSIDPVYDALTSGTLSKSDFDFVRKEFAALRSPEGEDLAKVKAEFVKRAAPMITRANELTGEKDPEGQAQLFNFERAVERKVEAYRTAGKDPYDLFDKDKPDFVGRPSFVEPFQTTFQDALRAKVNRLQTAPVWPGMPAPDAPPDVPRAVPPAAGAPVATAPIPPISAPGVTPRQSGESLADYVKRTGAALPGAPR